MTRSPEEVQALFRRWRRSLVLGLAALTAVIGLAYLLLAAPKEGAPPAAFPAWASLMTIYGIAGLYSVFNWRAVKRAFLDGASAEEALRSRL